MLDKSFQEIEHETWSQKASIYDTMFGDVTGQAIYPILDSLGSLEDKCHLDVACGPGHLVEAATRRGASCVGVDFAAPMVEAARANYPNRVFKVADAIEVPYDDAYFDAVSCAFGLLHMANPQAAVDEAFRVLKPGGRFAFTLWFGPERGGELQAIVKSAIQAHATRNVVLPEAWTVLRYANEAACEALIRRSGFISSAFQTLPIIWRLRAAQDAIDFIDKLSLRTAMMIQSQPESIRARIHDQILSDTESRRCGGVITLAWPALLTVAQKSA
jgi:ubiquinone/menaquinone biosynthesis C-methylase UbiE